MTVHPIRLFGDPVLRTPADPVVDFDKQLRNLVEDLTDTMLEHGSAGLAAPQLGVGLRVFTFDVNDVIGHLVNPELTFSGDDIQVDAGPWTSSTGTRPPQLDAARPTPAAPRRTIEGCASLPGLFWPLPRQRAVTATGFTMYGDPVRLAATDGLARCLQHEADHLAGLLILDRLDRTQRRKALRKIQKTGWYQPAPGT